MTPNAGDGVESRTEDDLFHQLNVRAWRNNRARAERLAELVAELGEHTTGDQRERARSLSHEIVGSAGTFGHGDASELARRMEGLLIRLPELPPAALSELRDLAERIKVSLARDPLPED